MMNSRRRVYPEHRAELAAAEVKIELGREIRIGQSVAIGHREVLGVAEIARRRLGDASASHCQLAGIGQRHLPVAAVIDAVYVERIGPQIDRHIAVHRVEIQEVIADDLALISHA